MKRRQYLFAAGAAAVAGCGGTSGSGGADPETAGGEGEPRVTMVSEEFVTVDGEDVPFERDHAAVAFRNEGDALSGDVTAEVRFYDSSGEWFTEGQAELRSLRPGVSWLATVKPADWDDQVDRVADFEVDGTFDSNVPTWPASLELRGVEMERGENRIRVSGEVENTGSSEVSYVLYGHFLDSEGRVIHEETAEEYANAVPTGETRPFEVMPYEGDWTANVDDYHVHLEEYI